MITRIWKILTVLAALASCTANTVITEPIIDAGNTQQPVIKIKLNTHQKNVIQKAGNNSVSGLFVINGGVVSASPVACVYTVKNDTLIYSPELPLGYGMEFEVLVYDGKDTLRKKFSTPQFGKDYTAPSVKTIYPETDTIPANILMFHVVYNTPMNEDITAYKKVQLLDENGTAKTKVWREKTNWTAEGKHMVLMIHPGRIKRGIDLMAEEGPLFEEGKQYTLVITTAITDRLNQPIEKEYRKTFFIAKADREIPALLKDKIALPATATTQPLVIPFNDVMDYGTMQIGVEVFSANGEKVAGAVKQNNGKNWEFTPAQPWQSGTYKLVLNDYVTDLASNHLTRKFEELDMKAMKNREGVTVEFKPVL